LTRKIGIPRQATVIISPGPSRETSTIVGAPKARAFSDGAIESMNGISVVAPAATPALLVAISHFRRVGSTIVLSTLCMTTSMRDLCVLFRVRPA
jgi:hypothetical protein